MSADTPPDRQAPFTLEPVLPSTNNRFNKMSRGFASYRVALISPWSRVVPLPYTVTTARGWECHTHPEGDSYFRHVGLRTVTPVSPLSLSNNRVLEQAATALIEALGSARGDNAIEIYLNIPEDRKNAVQYCYIDHRNRQVFWARRTSTAELGLEPFESDGFLKSALTGEYWNHVENFPCHQSNWAEAEAELMAILGHGAIDDLTSPGSACPWSAKECIEYLTIIERFRILDHNGLFPSRVVSISRLWAIIARVRHINRYDLTPSRLNCLQGLLDYHQSQEKASLKIALGEAFCLGMSTSTFARLTALWNGSAVYHRDRYRLFEELRMNWVTMGVASLAILTMDTALLAAGHRSETTMVSASMAGASVFLSLILHRTHSKDRLATAPSISASIPQVKDYLHALRALSITFTLPHVLTVYSAVLLLPSLLMMAIANLAFLSYIPSAALIWFLPAVFPLTLFALFGERSFTFT